MALKKPDSTFRQLAMRTGHLRYAGTLDGTDLFLNIAFRGTTGRLVLGEVRQMSYSGDTIDISYVPLFSDWADGGDYSDVTLLVDDLVWIFTIGQLDEVISLEQELKKDLTNNMATGS